MIVLESSSNIYIGVTDSYGGWVTGIVQYYDDSDRDKVIGYIDYQLSDSEHEIYINMIQVSDEYKRRGIATEMLYALRNEYPDYYVDWGYTTPDGTALKSKLTTTQLNPEFVKIQNAIQICQDLLEKLEVKLNDDEWLSSAEQSEIDKVADKWQKVYDKKRDLEYSLDDMREYITVWKN